MIKIDRHISDLLYDHDCVIIPEMGGFLGSYSPASIHPVQHTFSPPSKKIAFNVFLKHNDGLLADYVAQREGLSYQDALKEIKEYVGQYYHELEAGQKFFIEKVGVLYMDSERHIQFDPFRNVNYLRNSFGFSAIQCLPVNEEIVSKKKDSPFGETRSVRIKDRPAVRLSPKDLSKSKKKNAVNALLLIGSILWFGLNVWFVAPSKITFASLNPFDTVLHKEPVKTIPPAAHPLPSSPVPEQTLNVQPAQPIAEKDTITQPVVADLPPTSSVESTGTENSEGDFFIIAGAFRSMKNAEKLADELKSQGAAEITIIENPNGFKMVSYKSFKSKDSAFAALKQLKEEEKGAWIYTRR